MNYCSTRPISTINSFLRLIGFKLKSLGIIRDGNHTYSEYTLERLPNFTNQVLEYFLSTESGTKIIIGGDSSVYNFLYK